MKIRFHRPLFLVVSIIGMLLALSLQMKTGRQHEPVGFFFWDYWLDTLKHLGGFILIGFAYFAGIFRGREVSFGAYVRTIWPVMAFGALTETAQIWIPTRSCNFFDLLANTLGPLLGYLIVLLLTPKSGADSA
ncbi:VanZ family protein [bacterium]|nr:VanZ family protein [bacterium]